MARTKRQTKGKKRGQLQSFPSLNEMKAKRQKKEEKLNIEVPGSSAYCNADLTPDKKRQMILMEEGIIHLELSIENLNTRKREIEAQIESRESKRRSILHQLTEQRETKYRLGDSQTKHMNLLHELQKSLSKSQEILVRLNGDGSTGLLSKAEIEKLTDEIHKQEQRTKEQQQQQQKQQETQQFEGAGPEKDMPEEPSSERRISSNVVDNVQQTLMPVQSIHNLPEKLAAFWDQHGDIKKKRCLLSFIPCISCEAHIAKVMDIYAREALAEETRQGTDFQTSAEYRRQSLWNTCLDITLMAGKRFEQPSGQDDSLDEKEDKSSDNNLAQQTSKFDPHITLCPYDLVGICADPYCPYQHMTLEGRVGGTVLPKELLPLPELHLIVDPQSKHRQPEIAADSEEISHFSSDGKSPTKQSQSQSMDKDLAVHEEDDQAIRASGDDSDSHNSVHAKVTTADVDFSNNIDYIPLNKLEQEEDHFAAYTLLEDGDNDEDSLDVETTSFMGFVKADDAGSIDEAAQVKQSGIWWLSDEKTRSLQYDKDRLVSFEAWLRFCGDFDLVPGESEVGPGFLSLEYKGYHPVSGVDTVKFLGRVVDCARVAIHAGRFDVTNPLLSIATALIGEEKTCTNEPLQDRHENPEELIKAQKLPAAGVPSHDARKFGLGVLEAMVHVADLAFSGQSCSRDSFHLHLWMAFLSNLLERLHRELEADLIHSEEKFRRNSEFVLNLARSFDDNGPYIELPDEIHDGPREALAVVTVVKRVLYGGAISPRGNGDDINSRHQDAATTSEVNESLLEDLRNAMTIDYAIRADFSTQSVVEDLLEPVWSVVRTCLRQQSGHNVLGHRQFITCLKACTLLGFTILGVLDGTVDYIEAGGANPQIFSAHKTSTLVQVDGKVYRILLSLKTILSEELNFPFMEMLLVPLLASSVAFSAHLGNFSKSQHRLEDVLGGYNTEIASAKSAGFPGLFFVQSELLWSQLVHLRASLPLSKQIDPLGYERRNAKRLKVQSVLPEGISVSHRRVASRIAGFGVHLHHICLSGDWNLVSRLRLASLANRSLNYKQALSLVEDNAEKLENFCMNGLPRIEKPTTVRIVRSKKGTLLSGFPKSLLLLGYKIRHLDLTACLLNSLPHTLGIYLPFLEELVVSDNNLSSLPDSITDMKRLTVLAADKNQIKELPQGFDRLTSLRKLLLTSNSFEEFPSCVRNLKNLEEIKMSRNFFTTSIDSAQLTLELPKLRIFEGGSQQC